MAVRRGAEAKRIAEHTTPEKVRWAFNYLRDLLDAHLAEHPQATAPHERLRTACLVLREWSGQWGGDDNFIEEEVP